MNKPLNPAVAIAATPAGIAGKQQSGARQLYLRLLLAAILLLLVALPGLLSQALVNAAIQMLIGALFASAFNVLAGQGGMLSFGHAAYFGIGAFATLHAMNALGGAGLLPTPLMPVFGALGGAALGLAAGWFQRNAAASIFR